MKIAVVGCAHGEIEEMITQLQHWEKENQSKVDLLICCGDFQAIRNENDLSVEMLSICLSVSPYILISGSTESAFAF